MRHGIGGGHALPWRVVRAWIVSVVLTLAGGCAQVLGISDPTPAGDAGADAPADADLDAAPPCATAPMFGAERVIDTGEPALGFTVGDFDADPDDDLVIATGDDLVTWIGDGTGAFTPGVRIASAASDVIREDFDSDGDDDLVFWTVGGTAVTQRRQDRTQDPPFLAEQPLTGPFTDVQRVLEGRLDGALRPDVLVHDASGSREYTSNLGTPGTFAREELTGTGADRLLLLRQLDNLERDDAVFVNAGTVALARHGQTAFGALAPIATGAVERAVAFAKIDGDNLPDLVVGTTAGLVLYRQTTPGTFTMHGALSAVTATAIDVADVNGDGRDDLVVPTGILLQCAPATGTVGVFTQFEAINAAGPLVLRDVTGDGKLDLVRLDGTNLRVRVQ